MNYFIDTEFYERGPTHPIELISLGIVCEDGRELYIENADVDLERLSPWLTKNVVPHLDRTISMKCYWEIAHEVTKFIEYDEKPYFWGYYCDYDWVVFCQIFGSMVNLPSRFPQFCLDIKQVLHMFGIDKPLLPKRSGPEHHALYDAREVKALHWYLRSHSATVNVPIL